MRVATNARVMRCARHSTTPLPSNDDCAVERRTRVSACDARPVECLAGDTLRPVASVDAENHESFARVATSRDTNRWRKIHP